MAEPFSAPPPFRRLYESTRHVGKLEDATGRTRTENPACGDLAHLDLRVEGERVAAIRFKCHGCSSAIASLAAVCELVEGKTLAEARRIDVAAVDAAVGGLPPLRRHGADLAIEALAAAIADHEARKSGA